MQQQHMRMGGPQQRQPVPQQSPERGSPPTAFKPREKKIALLSTPDGKAIAINPSLAEVTAEAEGAQPSATEFTPVPMNYVSPKSDAPAQPAVSAITAAPASSVTSTVSAASAALAVPAPPVSLAADATPAQEIRPTAPPATLVVPAVAFLSAEKTHISGGTDSPASSNPTSVPAPFTPSKRLQIVRPPNKALAITKPLSSSKPALQAEPAPEPVVPSAHVYPLPPALNARKPFLPTSVTSALSASASASHSASVVQSSQPSPTSPSVADIATVSDSTATPAVPHSLAADVALLRNLTNPAGNVLETKDVNITLSGMCGEQDTKSSPVAPVVEKIAVGSPTTDSPVSGKTADELPLEAELVPDEKDDESPPSPPRRQRPATMSFGAEERKCFPRTFIMAMRDFSPLSITEKYLDSLSKARLVKPESSETPEASAGRDGGRDDPRGRADAALNRGAQANAGADMSNMRARSGGATSGGGFPGFAAGSAPRSGAVGAVGASMPGVGMSMGDSFDLRSARSNRPPPGAPGVAGGRQGDPRGTGTLAPVPGGDGGRGGRGGGGGRFDGPTRSGHMGPLDPYEMFAPVEKLSKGENAWVPQKEEELDELTATVKKVRSLLNKLTLEKFDRIFAQITALDISSLHVLKGIVSEIFEKTLGEPMFAGMYAELCRRLNTQYDESGQQYQDEEGKTLTFRHVLLKNCQKEFTRFAESQAAEAEGTSKDMKAGDGASRKAANNALEDEVSRDGEKTDEGVVVPVRAPPRVDNAVDEKLEKAKTVAATLAAKKRMLGNVRFIGELYKKDLITEQVVHKHCIQPLLSTGTKSKEEEVLEALCNILSRTGKKLSENQNGEAVKAMNLYFTHLNALAGDKSLSARVRFMLQDLNEQRRNGWNLRREEQGAKTIAEIKADLDKEERVKEQAQAARNSGRGGGGSRSGGFNRPPPPRQNAPAMTMAAANRGSSGGSRQTSLLEKYKNHASSAGTSGGAAPVRLGPSRGGASAGGQWSSATGSGSLRPRAAGSRQSAPVSTGSGSAGAATGRSNPFAALADTSEPLTSDTRAARWSGSRGSTPGSGPSPLPATPPAVGKMEHDKLKRKTVSYVTEFWGINDMKELRECLLDELKAANFEDFVTEAVKFCLESKPDERVKAVPLFVGIIGDPIPLHSVINGFSAVIANLSELEVDDPRAANTLAMYLGRMAASGKLGSSDGFGLEFLNDVVSQICDKKKVAKLLALVFYELEKGLRECVELESERKCKVSAAYRHVGIDFKTLAKELEVPHSSGSKVLKDVLKDASVLFLAPALYVDEELSVMLKAKKSAAEIKKFITDNVPENEYKSPALADALIAVALEFGFSSTPINRKDFEGRIKPCLDAMREICFVEVANPGPGSEDEHPSPPVEAQMAVLLKTQGWLYQHLKSSKDAKQACVEDVFHVLYDNDIVEEEIFVEWKRDAKLSHAVEGKAEAILSSLKFFKWLESE